MTLDDLLQPLGASTFFAKYWGKAPVHIRGAAAKFRDVLDWQGLSALLSQSSLWSAQTLELVLDRRKLKPEEYCTSGLDRDQRATMIADIDAVGRWLKRGASLVLNEVDALTPGLKQVSQALEAGLDAKIQGNLYCSWGGRQGFASHFDPHDVYAVHLEGVKTWRIYGRHFENPINHRLFTELPTEFHQAHRGELTMEVTLEPGDLLYIPRGWYHDALASSEGTIHVAFGAVAVIGLDIIAALYEGAVQDPSFRADLPLPREGEAALSKHLAGLGDHLAKLSRNPRFVAAVAQRIAEHRTSRGTIDLPGDVVARRYRALAADHPQAFKLVAQGTGWALSNGQQATKPLPAPAVAPIRWMLDQASFDPADFAAAHPAIPEEARGQMIADLVALGAIDVV